jgi:hypothetical protein
MWPALVAVVFVCLGTAYFFRWGSVVRHHPYAWISPDDLWSTLGAAVAFTHGHFNGIYKAHSGFLAYPGILILLVPVAALSGSLQTSLVEITSGHHVLAHPQVLTVGGSFLTRTGVLTFKGGQYLPHPDIFVLLAPYTLLLSCSALFACDALAERLQVTASRRIILTVVEGVVLWNVSVFWGHPEDAVALALAIYAVLFAWDDRWTGAGWLFGAAVAVQPLVIVVLPILLVIGGRGRALALVVRTIVPAAVVTVAPLVASFHATVHALVTQPAYSYLTHRTPWTALAPKLGGKGASASVGGGPVRIVALALAAALGWWARRWRNKPEMLAWAVALALALRCYTESVMTSYYVWPALAVGLVVAARAGNGRFAVAIVAAVVTTVVAQWRIGEWPWWIADVGGVTALLVVSVRPGTAVPVPVAPAPNPRPRPRPGPSTMRRRSTPAVSQKAKTRQKEKAARAGRKRSARR